jgi:succinate dehydrogenase flavin-adding protein (antitoxin of CptAB toxin-antitoxin module)
MVSYEELHQQNHKITELTNILQHLLGDRLLCDSEVTCDLFFEYVSAVKEHMAVTDSGMYSKLLGSGDQKLNNIANRFMGGSREINRIFSAYLKRWCKIKNKELVIKEYDAFMQDTQEMFEIVLDRIQNETEHLYPAVRKLTGDSREVA